MQRFPSCDFSTLCLHYNRYFHAILIFPAIAACVESLKVATQQRSLCWSLMVRNSGLEFKKR